VDDDPFAAPSERVVRVLHDVYDDLRGSSPSYWSPALGGCVLTRYTDVRAALTDERLTADRTGSWLANLESTDGEFGLLAATRRDMLLFSDGPEHARLRRMLMPMMRARSNDLAGAVREHVETLLDAIGNSSEIDIVAALAGPLPMLVLTSALGVPAHEGPRLLAWSRAFNATLTARPTRLSATAGQKAVAELDMWLKDVTAGSGIVDGLRRLVRAEQLPQSVVLATVLSLVSAGHGTVTDLIASSLDALGRAPDQLSWLTTNMGAFPSAFDELVRFTSPVQLTRREVRASISLAGASIAPGERVIVAIGSANRDPEVFDEPHTLDLCRADARRHLGFGFGAHRCPGVAPARMQAEIAVIGFVRRFSGFVVAEPMVWRPNLTLRGPARLTVFLRPAGMPAKRTDGALRDPWAN
jgi:cytochrome P450